MPSGKVVILGDTPQLLQRYGAKDVPITINQSTMYKIAYPQGYFGAEKQGHNLGIPALKQLPKQIAEPMAILKSNSQDNSMVLLTEWEDTYGNSVIVPFHLNKKGALETTNEIPSAYGKSNIKSLLTDNDGNSTVLYTKNNESIQQLLSNRLQLPEARTDDTLINNSISKFSADVNEIPRFIPRYNNGKTERPVFRMRENNTALENGVKKVYNDSANERRTSFLQEQFPYEYRGKREFIPNGSDVNSVKVIAGKGSDIPVYVEDRLIEQFGGNAGEWQKCVGQVKSAKYMFDMHWFELNGQQYKMKIKHMKELE